MGSISETRCHRLSAVSDFNVAFKHPVNDTPVAVIDVEYIKNRIKFIQEELKELLEAAEANDIAGVTDALLDIDYYNLGTVNGVGVNKEFIDGFELVQAANMAKLCKGLDELAETRAHYYVKEIETTFDEVLPGMYAVYNSETGKVMKSISYQAPDIASLFKPKTIQF